MIREQQIEPDMKLTKENPKAIPQHDYRLALQTAVSWLGDRYLLAEPISRRRKAHAPYFAEPRRWHDAPPRLSRG